MGLSERGVVSAEWKLKLGHMCAFEEGFLEGFQAILRRLHVLLTTGVLELSHFRLSGGHGAAAAAHPAEVRHACSSSQLLLLRVHRSSHQLRLLLPLLPS